VGYNELIPCGVTGVRNFFKEQSIRRPVKLSLEQIRNANLSANEEVHNELQALQSDETRVKLGPVSGVMGDILTVVAGL
jgi:transcription antitermination factor NusG